MRVFKKLILQSFVMAFIIGSLYASEIPTGYEDFRKEKLSLNKPFENSEQYEDAIALYYAILENKQAYIKYLKEKYSYSFDENQTFYLDVLMLAHEKGGINQIALINKELSNILDKVLNKNNYYMWLNFFIHNNDEKGFKFFYLKLSKNLDYKTKIILLKDIIFYKKDNLFKWITEKQGVNFKKLKNLQEFDPYRKEVSESFRRGVHERNIYMILNYIKTSYEPTSHQLSFISSLNSEDVYLFLQYFNLNKAEFNLVSIFYDSDRYKIPFIEFGIDINKKGKIEAISYYGTLVEYLIINDNLKRIRDLVELGAYIDIDNIKTKKLSRVSLYETVEDKQNYLFNVLKINQPDGLRYPSLTSEKSPYQYLDYNNSLMMSSKRYLDVAASALSLQVLMGGSSSPWKFSGKIAEGNEKKSLLRSIIAIAYIENDNAMRNLLWYNFDTLSPAVKTHKLVVYLLYKHLQELKPNFEDVMALGVKKEDLQNYFDKAVRQYGPLLKELKEEMEMVN